MVAYGENDIKEDGKWTENHKSPTADLPDPIGWKNWKISDWFMSVKKDRTPISPTAGRFGTTNWSSYELSDNKFDFEWEKQNNPVKYPQMTIAHHLSKRFHSPAMHTYFTDMGANMFDGQGGRCMDFEMQALECIEYYGSKQGITACKDWYDDYIECRHGSKQSLRVKAMFKKRSIDNHLEYLQGKRTWDETYEPPPKAHAYVEPWYNPKFAAAESREG